MNNSKLPQIIILYGPPNAGKGTQAHFLKQKLPKYYHLDFGSELRQFVQTRIGDFTKETEEVNPNFTQEEVQTARQIKDKMRQSLPVNTTDLRFVIETSINDCVKKGQGMIIEGPGRLVEEAKWLSSFLGEKKIETVIFNLYVSLELILERSKTRYYIKGIKKPFRSLTEAQKEATADNPPYRRPEDEDIEGTKRRYKMMYSENFAKIISIYQLQAKSLVFNIDASQEIEQVSADFLKYFQIFYHLDLS